MPHIHVQYIRKWKRALPHFDVRICPECGALVFRQAGQIKHQEDHERTRKVWDLLAQKTNADLSEAEDRWTWDAASDGGVSPMELERAELRAIE